MKKFVIFLVLLFLAVSVVRDNSDARKYDMTGRASWYSRRTPGTTKRTASNERFNDRAMTAAMRNVPFGKKVKVTNRENGRSVVVRINDRGPAWRYVREGRIVDLTKGAFRRIADPEKGTVRVGLNFL